MEKIKTKLVEITENQLNYIQGGSVITSNVKINFCPISGTQLSDDDINKNANDYEYTCPGCGAKGVIENID